MHIRVWNFLGCLCLFMCACESRPPAPVPDKPADLATSATASPPKVAEVTVSHATPLNSFPRFTDVAAQIGIEFTYANGASRAALMVEATGGGAGWIDFDSDGLLDLYLCQGGNPSAKSVEAEPLDQLFSTTRGRIKDNSVEVKQWRW